MHGTHSEQAVEVEGGAQHGKEGTQQRGLDLQDNQKLTALPQLVRATFHGTARIS